MRAAYKPDELTPCSFEQAAGIFRSGLESITGKAPTVRTLALALAKVTLESGRKGTMLLTSCHCANPGNIKAGTTYEGMYTLYGCNEVLNGKVVWFSTTAELTKKNGAEVPGTINLLPPEGYGHPQARFRAYAGLTDGIYQYLDFIFNNTRWRDAAEELLKGDPVAYVRALKAKNYFTADEATYARGVTSIHTEFVARLSQKPAPVYDVPDLTGVVAGQPFNLYEAAQALNAAFAGRTHQIADDSTRGALREMSGLKDEEPEENQS